jgi:hypothetical protein
MSDTRLSALQRHILDQMRARPNQTLTLGQLEMILRDHARSRKSPYRHRNLLRTLHSLTQKSCVFVVTDGEHITGLRYHN